MAERRTHRIPVDPFRFDPGASTSLDRIIQTQHYWSSHGKNMDEQTQQDMTGFSARPHSTIENTVIILKMLFSTQPHYLRTAVTVRSAGHRMAPMTRIFACSQMRFENSRAKASNVVIYSVCRVGISNLL